MNREELEQQFKLMQEYDEDGHHILPKPCRTKVLVRLEKIKEKVSDGGIVYGGLDNSEFAAQGMCYGHVLGMGSYAGHIKGIPKEYQVVDFKIGDRVLFYRHSGSLLEKLVNGYRYRIIDEIDIECSYGNKNLLEETK